MSHALLDADIIAYRAAAKFEYEFDGERGGDAAAAIEYALKLTDEWTKQARCSQPILCFSGRDGVNFRKDIAAEYAKQTGQKPYKSDRKDKPVVYWDVVDALEEAYKVVRYPGLEADDVMGILAGDRRLRDPIVVSIDKDLLTVPCKYLNPDKGRRPVRIHKAEANRNWLIQTLKGDPVDGYKGCPRVGDKRAAAMLEGITSLREAWQVIVKAFESANLTEDDAIYNARMARILRHEDYENGEIILWHPLKSKQRRLRY